MTKCNRKRRSKVKRQKRVEVGFDGGRTTSDGGFIVLSEVDRKAGLTNSISACIHDKRDSRYITHELHELISQRVFQIAMGYEDCNDSDSLRSDPALKTAVGRCPESGADLASQPTFSRLENGVDGNDVKRLHNLLIEHYLKTQESPPKRIILDIDPTEDPAHGKQQQIHFHGFYGHYIYLPLLVYDGERGNLLGAVLRRGNAHASRGAVGLLGRIVRAMRDKWPDVQIIIRADAGFAVPRLYKYCEREGLGYIIGLITNERLRQLNEDILREAVSEYRDTDTKVRHVSDGRYQAGSWSHPRRVIMKAEAMPQGTNQRFLVTNLEGSPWELYQLYTQRGQVENYIKDLKNALKADRLSCHDFLANQFRLLLHSFAYVLMHHLRCLFERTELGRAQFDTLRLKLLKVGGRVKQSVRRIRFMLSESYPYKAYWELLVRRLGSRLILRC
ncbi:MAG: IS1380 family transposase [Planctomycetota bacterium]|nr:IS1380 family transposase [Planctomycetota bacterium]